MADLTDRYLEGGLSPAQARELAQAALDRPDLFDELTFQAIANAGLSGAGTVGDEEALKLHFGGKLDASGQRELAQAALENDELFDALAAHGAVEASLKVAAVRSVIEAPGDIGSKVVPFRRRAGWVAIIAVAAAAAIVAVYLARMEQPASIATDRPQRHTMLPTLELTAERPVLLARNLTPNAEGGASAVFRSATSDSRAPRPTGTIVATDNLEVTIDLGSLDGLVKDAELEVFRAGAPQPIGRLVVTTVFRERARARILSGAGLRAKDQVRVPAPEYLAAVLQQLNALAESGDLPKARETARHALAWADANAVGAGEKRSTLERLAALDFQAGDAASAEEHYRIAIASFDFAPAPSTSERVLTLNNLGALSLLRGDTTQAEARFTEARSADAQTLNNLGVVAELRGDLQKANVLYSDALRAVQNAPGANARDRQAVEANLARVAKSSRAKQ